MEKMDVIVRQALALLFVGKQVAHVYALYHGRPPVARVVGVTGDLSAEGTLLEFEVERKTPTGRIRKENWPIIDCELVNE